MAPSIGVAEYFSGKSVFITGATGFMGLVLVEKLLRSCPDVKTLYLLMRPKKGQRVEERLQDYVNSEVFEKVQSLCPKNLHKLRLVPGDVALPQLGISIQDQLELQQECQIIFHSAATVRFDMFIRDAVEINVGGTEKMLKFAETMKNLEVFLHVSTAYCHDYLDVLEEKLYTPKHNPQDIMNMVKWMDDEMLKSIEHELIHPLPNTYAYTKKLAEDLVVQYGGKFPIGIARPSVVIAAYKEPAPGWINNFNGPTGLIVAEAKGIYRNMYTRKNLKPDLIPVDVVINATILLAYTIGIEKPKDIRVCNIADNSRLNPKSWFDTCNLVHDNILKYPSSVCLWYPVMTIHESWLMYQIHAFFSQWLPAAFMDLLLFILRKKPFMVKVQKRLHHGVRLLTHYMTGDWVFKNDFFLSLREQISKEEREIFFTDYETIHIDEYVRNYVLGIRQYCCSESPSTIPKAKRLLKYLHYLHVIFKVIIIWLLLKVLYHILMKLFVN